MSDQLQERVWTAGERESAYSLTCSACDQPLQVGQKVVECPRCKTFHHLDCWIARGGCVSRGCPQIADSSLTATATPSYDPPAREILGWLPAAITILLFVLVLGGGVWTSIKKSSAEGVITVMVTADHDEIREVASDYADAHEDLEISVLVLPADAPDMYEQKLVIMLAAKEPPNLIVLPYSRFQFYASQGALAPLDSIRDEVASAIPYGDRLMNGESDGHLYGIPHPSRSGILAITAASHNRPDAIKLLLYIVNSLPFEPNVNDRLETPATMYRTIREGAVDPAKSN